MTHTLCILLALAIGAWGGSLLTYLACLPRAERRDTVRGGLPVCSAIPAAFRRQQGASRV